MDVSINKLHFLTVSPSPVISVKSAREDRISLIASLACPAAGGGVQEAHSQDLLAHTIANIGRCRSLEGKNYEHAACKASCFRQVK